jgi:hypothetical protein
MIPDPRAGLNRGVFVPDPYYRKTGLGMPVATATKMAINVAP